MHTIQGVLIIVLVTITINTHIIQEEAGYEVLVATFSLGHHHIIKLFSLGILHRWGSGVDPSQLNRLRC